MADAQLTKVAAPDGEKDLFEHRISLDLTPENAVFTTPPLTCPAVWTACWRRRRIASS